MPTPVSRTSLGWFAFVAVVAAMLSGLSWWTSQVQLERTALQFAREKVEAQARQMELERQAVLARVESIQAQTARAIEEARKEQAHLAAQAEAAARLPEVERMLRDRFGPETGVKLLWARQLDAEYIGLMIEPVYPDRPDLMPATYVALVRRGNLMDDLFPETLWWFRTLPREEVAIKLAELLDGKNYYETDQVLTYRPGGPERPGDLEAIVRVQGTQIRRRLLCVNGAAAFVDARGEREPDVAIIPGESSPP